VIGNSQWLNIFRLFTKTFKPELLDYAIVAVLKIVWEFIGFTLDNPRPLNEKIIRIIR
jgi:hypothetical protein